MSWSQFIGGLVFLGATFYWAFVKKLPDLLRDSLKQNRQYDYDNKLQIDNYYRSNGQSEMQKLIFDWSKLLIDSDGAKKLGTNGLTELQSNTIGYASEDTIKKVGDLMQFFYNDSEKNEVPKDPHEFVAYIAVIVSMLKKDFTGQTFNPIDLIRIKINDFSNPGEAEKYQSEIDKIYK